MTRILPVLSLLAVAAGVAFGQGADAPAGFDIADVHPSAPGAAVFRAGTFRAGRYELLRATLVDLIRTAYGFDADKVLSGPGWLDTDRFDVIAKAPADTTPDRLKLMLQGLLADRFRLVVNKATRPMPAYVLTAGAKPQLKQADGSGDTGCKLQLPAGQAGGRGGIRVMMNGTPVSLMPGMDLVYQCRNMSMEAFLAATHGFFGVTALGNLPLLDQTGLKGAWDFDVKWSLTLGPTPADAPPQTTVFEALEKQLGLKLELQKAPVPVLLVAGANEKPTDNPAGVADVLPIAPMPTAFEVADIKPSDPSSTGGRTQYQPGGRLNVQGMPLAILIRNALNVRPFDRDQLVGMPGWAETARFDIVAKAPAVGTSAPVLDADSALPMLRALLADRFKLKTHTEERPVPIYSLVTAKPKLTKADPEGRPGCKNVDPPPAGTPAGLTRVIRCQNVTMALFAAQLQRFATDYTSWPFNDSTGIDGSWDFVLSWTPRNTIENAGGRGGDAGPGPAAATAPEPVGGRTLAEALEKQLGIRLETQKRPMPVIIVDHLEEKPTEN